MNFALSVTIAKWFTISAVWLVAVVLVVFWKIHRSLPTPESQSHCFSRANFPPAGLFSTGTNNSTEKPPPSAVSVGFAGRKCLCVCARHERDERGEFERIMQHSHSFMLLWVLQHEVSRGKGAIAEGLPFRAKEDRQVPRLFRGHGSRTARRVNCCFARCIKTPRHRAAV